MFPKERFFNMGILTALFLVAPVSAVVDAITHPKFRLAQAVRTRELVLLAL